MLFNSYAFLFAFLPGVLVLFHVLRRYSWSIAILAVTAASIGFYGAWRREHVPLLAASLLVNYVSGMLIERTRFRRSLLAFGVVFDLGLLGWYKYAGFFTGLAGRDPTRVLALVGPHLPLAISFFTFQQIAYLFDVYRGRIRAGRPLRYAFFVTFFPQLIAGPIVRYQQIDGQLDRLARKRAAFVASLPPAIFFFSAGLFKKVVLADTLAQYVDPVFSLADRGGYVIHPGDAWIGTLAYSLQLYFDFSGYSDMALGLARLFGIVIPVNFFSPYKATSVIDFWRRWHISLSAFVRDYLYVPMGGNRRGFAVQMGLLLLAMTVVGLWHGAGLTFVAWGLYHGVLLVINHVWRRCRGVRGIGSLVERVPFAIRSGLSWAVTAAGVVFGWVLFRAGSFRAASELLQAMTSTDGWRRDLTAIPDRTLYAVAIVQIGILILAVLVLPNTAQWVGRLRHLDPAARVLDRGSGLLGGRPRRMARLSIGNAAIVATMLYLAVASLKHLTTRFLYFNF